MTQGARDFNDSSKYVTGQRIAESKAEVPIVLANTKEPQ